MSRWNRTIHDEALLDLHSRSLTDYEITGRMLDMGYPVALKDVVDARLRLRLKPHKRTNWEQSRPPEEKPNPVLMARSWLGKRLEEKWSGYFLDGVPVGLTTIMQELNRMRVNTGMEQLGPEKWRV